MKTLNELQDLAKQGKLVEIDSDTSEFIKLVSECLNYNSETGVFIWKKRPNKHFKDSTVASRWNSKNAGKVAGNICERKRTKTKYINIKIKGKGYYAHRLAWLIVHGKYPSRVIDHIDRDGTNNAISNLRDATDSENAFNRSVVSKNTSGFRGVSWSNYYQKWVAKIKVNHKAIHLGYFDNKQDAINARKIADIKYIKQ